MRSKPLKNKLLRKLAHLGPPSGGSFFRKKKASEQRQALPYMGPGKAAGFAGKRRNSGASHCSDFEKIGTSDTTHIIPRKNYIVIFAERRSKLSCDEIFS